MIYYLISPSYINVVTFASILFAFAVTCLAIYMGKNILPRDGGRAYAINGSKSVGKPRGAGIMHYGCIFSQTLVGLYDYSFFLCCLLSNFPLFNKQHKKKE